MKIEKKADVLVVLGNTLGVNILNLRRANWKKLPHSIDLTETKPSFGLNDGGTLDSYAVDLKTGEILSNHYCGSADSAVHHKVEQFSEGHTPPDNTAIVFIETCWNGRNTSWFVTVVSPNIVRQINQEEL